MTRGSDGLLGVVVIPEIRDNTLGMGIANSDRHSSKPQALWLLFSSTPKTHVLYLGSHWPPRGSPKPQKNLKTNTSRIKVLKIMRKSPEVDAPEPQKVLLYYSKTHMF